MKPSSITATLPLLLAALGLLSCRDKSSPATETPGPVSSVDLPRIESMVPHLPGFLQAEGVSILGLTDDTTQVFRETIIHVAFPDSVKLRNWERFQEFYRRAYAALEGKGTFILADRMRKVRLEFNLQDNTLTIEDSTGYLLAPRPTSFQNGADRIRKTPGEAGVHEKEGRNGSTEGVRCNGIQDVNGRLYYNLTSYSFQGGNGASSPPYLVDALTGEKWDSNRKNGWTAGKGAKTRLLHGFPDTVAQNWRVVASNCEEDGYFWQFQPSSRKLERISLESLESVAEERLPAEVKGAVVSIRESGSPEEFDYRAYSLVRDGDHFTLLRSRGKSMFASRWEPPQPKDLRYVTLSPGSDRNHISFDDKEYAIDQIDWQDLATEPSTQIPSTPDSSASR